MHGKHRYYRQNAKIIADVLRKKNIPFTGGVNSPYIWFECPNGMESWEFFDYLLTHAQVVEHREPGLARTARIISA